MAAAIGQAGAAQAQRASRIFTTPQSLGPPIKGWNTRDPYYSMDAQDAIQLDNWYPDYGGCVTRPGSVAFGVTDSQNNVETLAVWQAGSNSAMVAASGGKLYDVSAGNASDPVVIGAGPYNRDWWGWTNFNSHLILCNGVDGVLTWTGPGAQVAAGAFTIDSASGFPSTYINAMLGVIPIHNRLFFWTGKDAGFWYGPLNGIAGTISFFPFDMVLPNAGAVIAINILTFDSGTGPNTYTTFFLSNGTMASYAGTDPTNPANWSFVGYYEIASPVGPATYPNRSIMHYGGDCYIITSSDHTKLSLLLTALMQGVMPPKSKITQAVIDAVAQSAQLPGWQAIYWGYRRRLIFNIPLLNGDFQQHVYNPALDAWSRSLNLCAFCWVVWKERLFFGSEMGQIIEHGPPNEADSDDQFFQHTPWGKPWGSPWAKKVVVPIAATAIQAWNMWGTPIQKRVAMVRAVIQSRVGTTATITLGYDYQNPTVDIPVNVFGIATPWGSAWGSAWSSEIGCENDWEVAEGDGSVVSIGLAMQAWDKCVWTRSDFRFEQGTAL